MLRSLFFTTALVGIASSAAAQGVYVNGVYTPAGGSVTVPANGSVTLGAEPTLGTTYDTIGAGTQPTTGYQTLGGQYEAVTHSPTTHSQTTHSQTSNAQTLTITPGSSQTFTVPTGQDTTYNVVVPAAAAAPVTTYAPQPEIYAESPAIGWKARGVYVGARAGLTSPRDTDFTIGAFRGNPPAGVKTDYDEPGYTGSLVVGYGARPTNGAWGYRVELEGGYQTANVNSHTIEGAGRFSGGDAQGDTKILYGFVNAYGDIPLTDRLALTAGGGVGIGYVDFDGHAVRGIGTALDDSAAAFGYHLDAGVSYQLSEAVALEAIYRYQSFIDAEVTTENGNEQKIDVDSHSVLAGVRVGF